MRHICCAPYHTASNGQAECFVQTFKRHIKAGCQDLPLHQCLMTFLLSYRSTPHSTTNFSPSSLFLRRELKTRLDLLHPSVEREVARKQASQKLHYNLKVHMREINIGQRVLAQNYRDGPRWVSGTIIQRNSPVTYMVKMKSGDVWKRHIDQLREKFNSPQECSEIPVPVNHDDGNIPYCNCYCY